MGLEAVVVTQLAQHVLDRTQLVSVRLGRSSDVSWQLSVDPPQIGAVFLGPGVAASEFCQPGSGRGGGELVLSPRSRRALRSLYKAVVRVYYRPLRQPGDGNSSRTHFLSSLLSSLNQAVRRRRRRPRAEIVSIRAEVQSFLYPNECLSALLAIATSSRTDDLRHT